jgi:hypothetical protein
MRKGILGSGKRTRLGWRGKSRRIISCGKERRSMNKDYQATKLHWKLEFVRIFWI